MTDYRSVTAEKLEECLQLIEEPLQTFIRHVQSTVTQNFYGPYMELIHALVNIRGLIPSNRYYRCWGCGVREHQAQALLLCGGCGKLGWYHQSVFYINQHYLWCRECDKTWCAEDQPLDSEPEDILSVTRLCWVLKRFAQRARAARRSRIISYQCGGTVRALGA